MKTKNTIVLVTEAGIQPTKTVREYTEINSDIFNYISIVLGATANLSDADATKFAIELYKLSKDIGKDEDKEKDKEGE